MTLDWTDILAIFLACVMTVLYVWFSLREEKPKKDDHAIVKKWKAPYKSYCCDATIIVTEIDDLDGFYSITPICTRCKKLPAPRPDSIEKAKTLIKEVQKVGPTQFAVGEVYEMAVAFASHVTKPYYVIIKDVTPEYIETHIPGRHSLKIYWNTTQWDYHYPRMTFIGNDAKSRKLAYNQNIQHKS